MRYAGEALPPPGPRQTNVGRAVRVTVDTARWSMCGIHPTRESALRGLIETLRMLAGEPQTAALLSWYQHAFGCIVIWLLFGLLWSLATAWRRPR
jgi:hypothetical protein